MSRGKATGYRLKGVIALLVRRAPKGLTMRELRQTTKAPANEMAAAVAELAAEGTIKKDGNRYSKK